MKIFNHITRILDWIYPPACLACQTLIAMTDTQPRDMKLCSICQGLFEPIQPPVCKFCGCPTAQDVERCVSCHGKTFHFTCNRATFVYDELMRDLLHALKFRQNKQIAHSLGKLWAKNIAELPADSIIVPLPLHRAKKRERGFNQAEVMASHIAAHCSVQMEDTLIRTIDTPPQSGLHPRQRAENVAGAFAIKKGANPRGKSYLIIDDIYTTGASLNECAKVLKEAGAARVECLTLCVVEKKE